MGYPIKQNQTAHPLTFIMLDSSDHITGKTGLTPTVTLSKNGGSGAAPAGAVSEVDATNNPGLYAVAGNATDANTLGPLDLHATATGADPQDEEFLVVAYDPFTGTNLGLSALPTAAPQAAGGLITSTAGSLDLDEMNVDVEAIQAKTDNLPSSPAAVGSAMTLTSAYDAAKTAAQPGDAMALIDAAITAAKIAADAANKLADHARRRTQAHVEASSDGDALSVHSQYGMVQQVQNSDTTTHANKLTVFKTDNTELAQVPITGTSGADPITKVGP